MDDGKAAAALAAQQQQQQQQMMMLQQIQRQKDAISRFPSNIDAHLRPQQHHRPLINPNSSSLAPINPQSQSQPQSQPQQQINPNSNPQVPQQHKQALQMAYQDAWKVCHPDFKRPFSSLEDACDRLLPYHVVADYEAEEDDKILDSATTGQILSRSQQWDHNIAAKVAEFTATFEKQVLAFNIISRKRGLGEFRTEEKLMMEQLLLQDEKRGLLELRAEMDSRQKAASRETHEANMRMAAMQQAQQAQQAHAEMMARGPIRASALVGGGDVADEQEEDDDVMNGWGGGGGGGNNNNRDDREMSEDFLNDDETENGDTGLQSEWRGVGGSGELDLNAR